MDPSAAHRTPHIRRLNAEPLLLLYSIGLGLYITVYQAFISFKICVDTSRDYASLIPSELSIHDFCTNLIGEANNPDSKTGGGSMRPISNYTDRILDTIESESARFMIWYQVLNNVPAIFMAFMVGSWSDHFGRKPPIIVALFGSTAGAFIVLMATLNDSTPIYLILISTFVNGATGQVLVIYSGAFSMITDAELDPERLTVRIGYASGVLSIGIFLASIVSGLILGRWENYSYIFLLSLCFVGFAFLYTVFFCQETIELVRKQPAIAIINDGGDQAAATGSDQIVWRDGGGNVVVENPSALIDPEDVVKSTMKRCQFCRELCNFGRMKESFVTLIKKRPGRHRLYLWVTMIGFLLVFSSDFGMPGILNLYAKRPPISLTDSDFSYLTACGTAAMTVGMTLVPWLSKRVLHQRDTFLIVFGLFVGIGKMMIIAFARAAWMIFLGATIGGISAVYFAGFRAFLSKLVDRDETGRLFAVITLTEHLGPLISALIFNNIFAITLRTFAGCVFLVAAMVLSLALVVMGWVHFDSGRMHDDVDEIRREEVQQEVEGDQENLIQA